MARHAAHARLRKPRGARDAAASSLDIRAVLTAAAFTPAHIQRIMKRYGTTLERVLRVSPYRLTREIEELPFVAVDRLARQLGRPKGDRSRVQAGIHEILRHGMRSGHTWLPLARVVKRTAALLSVPASVIEEQCLRVLVQFANRRRTGLCAEVPLRQPALLPRSVACVSEESRGLRRRIGLS